MVQQKNNTMNGTAHSALAKSLNLPVSTKHCVEIANAIRYKSTEYAKRYLEDVVALRRAVPFNRYKRNVGHKAGMASGRFPEKAARQFIKLVNSVEANAQFKGLNTSDLKIVKMTANIAPIPSGGGRLRHKTKRTHLEIVVREKSPAAKKKDVKRKGAEQVSSEAKVEARVKVAESPAQAAHHPSAHPATNQSVHSSMHSSPKTEEKVHEKVQSKTQVKGADVKTELSPEDLLKKAQARAAALNKSETDRKSVENVSKLYDELTSKGTLRDEKTTSVKR